MHQHLLQVFVDFYLLCQHCLDCRLMQIYQSVSRQPIKQRIDKAVLLSEFLKLNEFSLLKWCDYIG